MLRKENFIVLLKYMFLMFLYIKNRTSSRKRLEKSKFIVVQWYMFGTLSATVKIGIRKGV